MIKRTFPTQRLTYGGTPAEVTTYSTTTTRTGERVVATKWLADCDEQGYMENGKVVKRPVKTGQIDLIHCKGDGRKPTFQVFSKRTVRTDEAVQAFLELTVA